ncbi:class I SAM-dependent methyltransferase [Bacteroidota bacterium]
MRMKITDILIDPDTGEKLDYNQETNEFNSGDIGRFTVRIENNIPVILPKKISDELKHSEFHQRSNTEFEYLEHYQKDSEVHDYAKEADSMVVRDENRRIHQLIISKIPWDAKLVLDVGCGGGWLSKQIVNDSTQVISMDVSSENPLHALRSHPHENHFGLVADVFNLPIKEESIDCIVASEIMEHVPSPKLFIDVLLKALVKGGKLLITTPYNEKLKYHLCVHCNNQTPSNAHLHSFNETNIVKHFPESVLKWDYQLFMNNYFIKSRMSLLTRFLPFKLWRVLDKISNKVLRKPTRFFLIIEK